MPEEDTSWEVTAIAQQAFKHRNEIRKAWEAFVHALFDKKRSIAFTGLAGIGKTVLFDYLTGEAYKPGYKPPGPSVAAEKGKEISTQKRMRVTVVPGDQSAPRMETLESLFSKRNAVEGVVHVVANGFVDIRSPFARDILVKQGKLKTLDLFLKHQRKAELEDLRKTCELIRQSLKNSRRPTWMLIAVTKADLYQGDLGEVERYYSPHGNSDFTRAMKDLVHQAGSDNLRWDARPVSTCLEDFEWNGQGRASTLKTEERDVYVERFAKALGKISG